MLLFHAAELDGASVSGQYCLGHAGVSYLGLRLNSRMSHCVMRMCSSNIQAECGNPAGLVPRRLAGISRTTSLNFACACPPESSSSTFLRSSRSWLRSFVFVIFVALFIFAGS